MDHWLHPEHEFPIKVCQNDRSMSNLQDALNQEQMEISSFLDPIFPNQFNQRSYGFLCPNFFNSSFHTEESNLSIKDGL